MNQASSNPPPSSSTPDPTTPARQEQSQLGGSLGSRGYASPALQALHERILAEKKTTGPTIAPQQPAVRAGLNILPAPGATQEAQVVQLQCAREIDVLVGSLMEAENRLR